MPVKSLNAAARASNDNDAADAGRAASPRAGGRKRKTRAAARSAPETLARHYKIALDSVARGVCVFDDEGRLTLCNRGFLDLYRLRGVRPGASPQDVLALCAAAGAAPKSGLDRHFSRPEGQGAKTWTTELEDGRAIQVSQAPIPGGGWVSGHEDITEIRAMRALESERVSLQALIDAVPDYLWIKDADSRFVVANQALAADCGRSKAADMIGLSDFDIHAEAPAREFRGLEQEILRSGRPMTNREEAVLDASGAQRWLLSTKIPLRGEDDAIFGIVGVARDVTEEVRVKQELRRTREFLHLVIENIPEAIIVKDVETRRYTMMNRAAEQLIGMARADLIGRTAEAIYPERYLETVKREDEELLQAGELSLDNHKFEIRGKAPRVVALTRKLLRDEAGAPQFMLAVIQDITDRRRSEERIAHMALHDPLTNLPNRAQFNERLDRAMRDATVSGERFAVVCIDLDRLKEVNDVFGHAAGDQLLREVSSRLLAAAGGAFLARLGGDEFALITEIGGDAAPLADLTDRLLGAIVKDLDIQGVSIRAGLSLGVAVFPDDGDDAKTLLANADAALYRAKAEGRGIARFFRAEMDEQRRDHHVIRHDLSLAIERGEFAMHYQPQSRITGEIVGFEALLRWRHPLRGFVPPGVFIPIAEESRLINRIGEWVLRDVCREAATWPRHLSVAVNLSPVQFQHGDLPGLVRSALLETGLAADRLELEITEGVLMADSSRALGLLRRLKALGVKIVMDDFGKGYSSLSYLQSFPFDKIKMDRAFVSKVENRPQAAAIVRAILGLARGLTLPLLAEGVETPEELAFLAAESCDQVQGYLTGRPRPIEDYVEITEGVRRRLLPRQPLDERPRRWPRLANAALEWASLGA